MVKCKVCGEKVDFLYFLGRGRICVYCYVRMNMVCNPVVESEEEHKEWCRRDRISNKAVKEFFKIKRKVREEIFVLDKGGK